MTDHLSQSGERQTGTRRDDWLRFEVPDTYGTMLTLLVCPICHATVPSGLSLAHAEWHEEGAR